MAGENGGPCPCEGHGHGDLGPVAGEESLARVVVSPQHISKKDGSIKPGLFAPSHINESGLSLMRRDHMNFEKFTEQVAAVTKKAGVAIGIRTAKASDLRAEVNAAGERDLCVHDDPIMGDEHLPDNPAHAEAKVPKKFENHLDPEVLRIQGRLMDIFGPLVKLEDVYAKDAAAET